MFYRLHAVPIGNGLPSI